MTEKNVRVNARAIRIISSKLYDLHPAIIGARELVQNSHDACLRAGARPDIRVTLKTGTNNDNYGYWLSCEDNGDGMTAEIIESDFLDLGGSYHTVNGEVGGFGFGAKPVLFSCEFWQVYSRDNIYSSDHFSAGLDVHKTSKNRVGTLIDIFINQGDNYLYTQYVNTAIAMLALSNLEVTAEVDVDDIKYSGKLGFDLLDVELQMEDVTEYFTCYLMPRIKFEHLTFTGLNIYRVNGLVQFITRSNRSTNLIFDLNVCDLIPEDDLYPLKLNREELTGGAQDAANTIINKHNENPLSSETKAKNEKKDKQYQDGILLSGLKHETRSAVKEQIGLNISELWVSLARTGNNDKKSIATLFVNYENVTANDRRILRTWTNLVQICADIDESFGVGLTSINVACRTYYNGNPFYLINPTNFAHITDKDALILALYFTAVHETSHKYHSSHNEYFTSKMGEICRVTVTNLVSVVNQIKRTILRRLS